MTRKRPIGVLFCDPKEEAKNLSAFDTAGGVLGQRKETPPGQKMRGEEEKKIPIPRRASLI